MENVRMVAVAKKSKDALIIASVVLLAVMAAIPVAVMYLAALVYEMAASGLGRKGVSA